MNKLCDTLNLSQIELSGGLACLASFLTGIGLAYHLAPRITALVFFPGGLILYMAYLTILWLLFRAHE